ncbi:unnamed protein product [Clonostachys rosea f. rosea IK726]|uniref:Zn(2)-C6 fungal-type domain-containing protein n=2 Tax=Bionectria ochroleuca TaxID=29856 RepID=A0A0B7JN11_BIOOC|nr:unnamed protein product [Clonostachys rosea f. rosea IK726]
MEDPTAHQPADEAQPPADSSTQGDGGKEDPNRKKPNVRKRTKTGCLTCRKRRIKCDENRPTCNNCIKSKRTCEGYSKRVVFKAPIGSHPLQGPFGSVGYLQGTHPLSEFGTQQIRPPGQGLLPTIAPRPPAFEYVPQHPHGLQYGTGEVPQLGGLHSPYELTPPYPHGLYTAEPNPLLQHAPPNFPPPVQPGQPYSLPDSRAQQYQISNAPSRARPFTSIEGGNNYAPGASSSNQSSNAKPNVQIIHETYESEDEDASLADSDDEAGKESALVFPSASLLPLFGDRATSLRSFTGNSQSQMVADYMNYPHIAELRDQAKRQIFHHFIKVTGPSMSLYERHPFDPSERDAADVDSGSNNIWSYTFPVLAFQHPGLLQAMLAMSSLQIARLQGIPPTAAHKHYHIALRRIAKNVQSVSKRVHPATIAATLLLGYFEVWNSEHTSWCNHLYGARSLFAEIPLRRLSQKCLPVKSMKERQKLMKQMGLASIGSPIPKDPATLDYELLTTLTGFHVAPSDYGLREDQVLSSSSSTVTDKDIADYENLRDLFWWYCKMDVYQSILGGAKLFMEYEQWTQCPPRAPASKLSGIYGTYDHLMLLLGRLANFQSNDSSRKRQAYRAQGSASSEHSPPSFPGMLPNMGGFRAPMGFSPPRNVPSKAEAPEQIDLEGSLQSAMQEWEGILVAFQLFKEHLGPEFQPLGPEYTDRRERPFGLALQYRTFSVAGIWLNYYMGLIALHRSHPSMPPTAMQSVGLSARKTAEYANLIGRIAVGMFDGGPEVTEVSTVSAAALIESAICLFVAAVQFQDEEQRKWVVRRLFDITRLTGWQSAQQIAEGCETSWIKAAQMSRGPAYERTINPNATDDSVWKTARRIDRRIQEVEQGEETRLVLARVERAHYALGLLGVEDDLEFLDLGENAVNKRIEPEE